MTDNINSTLAKNLRSYRWKRKLSQQRLAELSGVSQSIISKIERNALVRPTVQSVHRLADILRISFKTLIERKSE